MPGFKNIWYLGTIKMKKMKFNEWRWKVLNLLIHNHIQAGAANSWWQDSGFWGLPAKHEWGTQRMPWLREYCDPGLQFPRWQSAGFWKIHSSIKAMRTLPKSNQNQYFHNSGNYLKSCNNLRSICSGKMAESHQKQCTLWHFNVSYSLLPPIYLYKYKWHIKCILYKYIYIYN